uniref:Uncharacterized protein n=1 Tax=Cuerna arida TaxID=1464854 RepID=A0A1B6GQA6_9HEMI
MFTFQGSFKLEKQHEVCWGEIRRIRRMFCKVFLPSECLVCCHAAETRLLLLTFPSLISESNPIDAVTHLCRMLLVRRHKIPSGKFLGNQENVISMVFTDVLPTFLSLISESNPIDAVTHLCRMLLVRRHKIPSGKFLGNQENVINMVFTFYFSALTLEGCPSLVPPFSCLPFSEMNLDHTKNTTINHQ